MDKPSEQALNPKHERLTGSKRDSKSCDDTDIGLRKFGPDNVRASLPTLWDHAPKEVVGLGLDRLLTNDYCKSGDKDSSLELAEEMISSGPPFSNVSAPKRIL
jgi:hypothetical protein